MDTQTARTGVLGIVVLTLLGVTLAVSGSAVANVDDIGTVTAEDVGVELEETKQQVVLEDVSFSGNATETLTLDVSALGDAGGAVTDATLADAGDLGEDNVSVAVVDSQVEIEIDDEADEETTDIELLLELDTEAVQSQSVTYEVTTANTDASASTSFDLVEPVTLQDLTPWADSDATEQNQGETTVINDVPAGAFSHVETPTQQFVAFELRLAAGATENVTFSSADAIDAGIGVTFEGIEDETGVTVTVHENGDTIVFEVESESNSGIETVDFLAEFTLDPIDGEFFPDEFSDVLEHSATDRFGNDDELRYRAVTLGTSTISTYEDDEYFASQFGWWDEAEPITETIYQGEFVTVETDGSDVRLYPNPDSDGDTLVFDDEHVTWDGVFPGQATTIDTRDVPPGEYVLEAGDQYAVIELTDLGLSAEWTHVDRTADVAIPDQESDGQSLRAGVALPDGGSIAIENTDGTVIGESDSLEADIHENVTVTLAEPLTENTTVTAVALDEDGHAYTEDGERVTDTADVTVTVSDEDEHDEQDGTDDDADGDEQDDADGDEQDDAHGDEQDGGDEGDEQDGDGQETDEQEGADEGDEQDDTQDGDEQDGTDEGNEQDDTQDGDEQDGTDDGEADGDDQNEQEADGTADDVDDDGPGFGFVAAVLALLGASLLAHRRF